MSTQHKSGMWFRRPVFLAAGALVVVVVVPAVILLPGGTDESDPAMPAKPAAKQLELAGSPLWTTRGSVVQALGDVVLTWEDDRFVVHDAATGGSRWTLQDKVELLGGDGASPFRPHGMGTRLVGHGDATAVLVGYRDEEEQGLALLSGADGRVVWKTPILAGDDERTQGSFHTLWTADDRTALVSVERGDFVKEAAELGNLTTVAVDVVNGRRLWEHSGVWPHAIAGDTVLAESSTSRPDEGTEAGVNGTLVALDAATGQQRWDLSTRFAYSRLGMTVGDVALVQGFAEDASTVEYQVVAVSTGEVLARFGDEYDASSCVGDGEALIACPVRDGHQVATFRVDDRKTEVTTQVLGDSLRVDGAWRDRVFVDSGGYHTIDRTGVTVDKDLPGRLAAMADGYAIFEDGDGVTSVYRIGR